MIESYFLKPSQFPVSHVNLVQFSKVDLMPKVTIIGAGSAVFATEIMSDILATPALESGTFALVDIHQGRLELAHQMAEFLIERSGRDWRVEASVDRAKVLADSDYVVHTIEVAGRENVRHDYDIPLEYGVDQCIGDTIGPGGLFKALRTLPAWLEILADVEQLAPGALVMNYTNPMSLTVPARRIPGSALGGNRLASGRHQSSGLVRRTHPGRSGSLPAAVGTYREISRDLRVGSGAL
jgi:hypothetical protein